MTITQRVRDYVAKRPSAGHTEIAKALGISYAQAKDCRGRIRQPSHERPALPTLMLRGGGERRHDCAGYEACLAGAARAYPDQAHCPFPCPSYEERDHSVDVAIGATVPRESTEGGLGEAERWSSGGAW